MELSTPTVAQRIGAPPRDAWGRPDAPIYVGNGGNDNAESMDDDEDEQLRLAMKMSLSQSGVEVIETVPESPVMDVEEISTSWSEQHDAMLAQQLAFGEGDEALPMRSYEPETAEQRERRLFREKQQEEFEASLAADKAMREARERAQQEEIERQEREVMMKQNMEQRVALAKQTLADEVGEEPEADAGATVAPDVIVYRVMLRLPNNARVARKFRSDDKLELVHKYAQLLLLQNEVVTEVDEHGAPAVAFDLKLSYPLRKLSDTSLTLCECGLEPRSLLVVEV